MKRLAVDEVFTKEEYNYLAENVYSVELVEDGENRMRDLTDSEAMIWGLPTPLFEGMVFESEVDGVWVDVTQRERAKVKELYSKLLEREMTPR